MKIISLSQYDIEAFIEQGAKVETKYRERRFLPLDFKRGYDGVDTYDVKIDDKYECTYSVRLINDCNGIKYLDKRF